MDGTELTVDAQTNKVDSVRFYYYKVPRSVLNDVARRLHADGVRFKILHRGNCDFTDDEEV